MGGFIALGYCVGLIVGAATIADMAGSSRSAWRNTGRRRRNAEASVVIAWLILGWGAVLAGIIWFAGNARTQVRSFYSEADIRETPEISNPPTPPSNRKPESILEIDISEASSTGSPPPDSSHR